MVVKYGLWVRLAVFNNSAFTLRQFAAPPAKAISRVIADNFSKRSLYNLSHNAIRPFWDTTNAADFAFPYNLGHAAPAFASAAFTNAGALPGGVG